MPALAWFQPFFPAAGPLHFANTTIESHITTRGWQSEPRTRGTWSIISSCIFTLTLCVFSAIHLNVPKRGSTQTQLVWSRTNWIFVGILAPELVVYTAWRQWTSARRLTADLAKLREERGDIQNESSGPSFLANWSMIHSFFAEMGGYTIETKTGRSITLTAKGVLRLIELGYDLPRVTREDIEDRSKADLVTKLITCVQAAYMIIQVIGRRAQDLPITMLEINTLGHVVCALIMFIFWFKKPWSVDVPVVIVEDWLVTQTQRMTHENNGFWSTAFWDIPRDHKAKVHRKTGSLENTVTIREDNLFLLFLERLRELEKFDSIPESATRDSTIQVKLPMLRGPPSIAEQWKETDIILVLVDADSDYNTTPQHIQSMIQQTSLWPSLITHIYRCSDPYETLWPTHTTRLIHGQALQIYLTLPDMLNWDRAWTSLCASGALSSTSAWTQWKSAFAAQGQSNEYTASHMRNWPSGRGQLQMGHRLIGVSLLSLATGIYGGLHLLLWDAYFPSRTERLLWRICASIIAVSGLIAGYLVLIVSHEKDPLPRWLRPVMWPLKSVVLCLTCYLGRDRTVKTMAKLTLAAAFVLAPCYCAARAYIVVECLVSLRQLPVDAYTTPLWTRFLPHL